jgi:TetR/AcrR family transcriptional regulator, mexJK operon transcriptional repressor
VRVRLAVFGLVDGGLHPCFFDRPVIREPVLFRMPAGAICRRARSDRAGSGPVDHRPLQLQAAAATMLSSIMRAIAPADHPGGGTPSDTLGGKAESVLATAQRNFLAYGFGAVSMELIAREADVSKATVYAHFASKEALFGAVVARVVERHTRGFSTCELDPRNLEASLTTLAHRFLSLVLSPEAIAVNRIIIGEVSRFPALADAFWQAGPEQARVQIEDFLRRAAEAGSLRLGDPRLATEQFAALVRGGIHQRRLFGLDREPDENAIGAAARAAVDTFLRGAFAKV